MNWQTLFEPSVSGRLCLTLAHTLWQLPLLALFAWGIERLWRKQSVEWNYAVHVGALVLCLVAIPLTYAVVEIPGPTAIADRDRANDLLADSVSRAGANPQLPPSTAVGDQRYRRGSKTADFAGTLAGSSRAEVNPFMMWLRIAPWLAAIYVSGVVLMLIRLARSIVRTERLRTRATPVLAGSLVRSLRTLSNKWLVRFMPLLAQTDQIVVPTVIGLLKPTILLPGSAITGLSTSELEMIIAHELAHVRRHDMWINLLQRLAEAVLFFNPALWYLSRRIGTLREYCCDEFTCREMSASAVEPRVRYAAALLKIVELAKPHAAQHSHLAALAASGRSPSELRRRVARLFGEPLHEPVRMSRGGLLLVGGVALLVACGSTMWPVGARATEETTSKPAIEIANTLTKELSFGSKAEVLALGTHDEQPQQWWDPRGGELKSVPFEWAMAGKVSSADKVWRRIVFRMHALPKDAEVRWHIDGAHASADGRVSHPNMMTKYFTRYFGVAEDRKFVELRVGVATGEWKTAAEISASGTLAIGMQDNKGVLSSGALDMENGTFVVVSHNYSELNYRVVAIDKQGNIHETTDRGGVSAGSMSQTKASFPGLARANTDHFEFQIRDYEWVEFNNLPLHPGELDINEEGTRGPAHRLDDSPEAAAKRAEWLEKLPRLSTHNQTAFAVGPLMIFELPANDAFEVVRQTWAMLQADEVKTGLLKTFEFARHPRVLDVLDLGARDESREVREYAYSYLQNYAMRDFKEPQHDYAAWRSKYADQPMEKVLQENVQWLVAQLRESKPPNDRLWWMNFEMMLNIDGNKSSYPSKAKYLREAGLADVLQAWQDDPAAGEEVKRGAAEILEQLQQ